MSTSLPLKRKKPIKPLKLNHRLNNQLHSTCENSPTLRILSDNCQFTTEPFQSEPMSTQVDPGTSVLGMNLSEKKVRNKMKTFSLLSGISPNSIGSYQQNKSIHPIYRPFSTPRVTTTLIPLNVCPTEHCQIVKPISIPMVNPLETNDQKIGFEQQSKETVITHFIGDWIIRESPVPFHGKNENEQLVTQEKEVNSNQSTMPYQLLKSNVNRWTVDDVCSFFERVLSKNCYAPIIREHLIDGTALLLLKDEHLINTFNMQLGPRLKILNHINKLKNVEQSSS